ncbi:malonic semialdehyde reductase [Lacibacterium aquatile]|uniref:Putative NADH dehydrogenase/NAD(P)H nitroreductase ACFSM5_12430 n=1 Tax=Lacibacterium aquatile TaxID=1168082 RepID=A0ABW5DRB6_9PROT
MPVPLSDDGVDLLFQSARTHRHWQDRPVDEELLRRIYELARLGPTSANCSPMRVLYIRTPEAKERLLPLLDKGNVERVRAAPVTAMLASDLDFWQQMDVLMPGANAKSWFEGDPVNIERTSVRNAWLQGGYFIMAARSLGLDCGPMGGFDSAGVDAEFFAGTPWHSTFLVNLGYGDPAKLRPRNPRLEVDFACRFV